MTHKSIETLIRILGCIVLIPLPFFTEAFIFQGTFPFALVFMIGVEVMFFLFVWLCITRRVRIRTLLTPITSALAVVILSALSSMFAGVSSLQSFWSTPDHMTGVLFLLHLFAYVVILSYTLRERRHIQALLWAISLGGLITLIHAYLGPEGFGVIQADGKGAFLGNTTFMGMALTFVTFAVLYLFTHVRKIWQKIVLGGMLVLLFFNPEFFNVSLLQGNVAFGDIVRNPLILLGEAQAAAIATAIGVSVWLAVCGIRRWVRKPQQQRTLFVVLSVFLLLATTSGIISLFSPNTPAYELHAEQSSSTYARPLVWSIGAQATADRPLFGWGEENFNTAFVEHFDSRLYTDQYGGETNFDRAHNIFFDVLATRGWLGLIAFGVAMALVGLSVVWIYRKERSLAPLLAVISVALFAHLLQLQTAFEHVASYIYTAAFLAILGSLYVQHMGKYRKSRRVSVHGGVAVILLVLCGMSIYTFAIRPWQANVSAVQAMQAGASTERLAYADTALSYIPHQQTYLKVLSSQYITAAVEGMRADGAIATDGDIRAHIREELALFAQSLEEYINTHPPDYDLLVSGARYMHLLHRTEFGSLEKAQQWSREAISYSPEKFEAYLWRDASHYSSGRREVAEESFSQYVQYLDVDSSMLRTADYLSVVIALGT